MLVALLPNLADCLVSACSPPATAPAARAERHETAADVDMDVVHGGIRHDAAGAMVGDQPLHHLRLAAARGVEVDGIAAGVPGRPAAVDNHRAGTARGDDPHGPELRLDTVEKAAGSGREARPRYASAGEADEAARGRRRGARSPSNVTPAPTAHPLPAARPVGGGAALAGARRSAWGARLDVLPISLRIRPIAVVSAEPHLIGPRLRARCERAQRGNADGHHRKTSHDLPPNRTARRHRQTERAMPIAT